jgi:hypothetical protein
MRNKFNPKQTHRWNRNLGFGQYLQRACLLFAIVFGSTAVDAQINTGSDGRDGALNPSGDLVINMADHPDGIYQYTSVNIPTGFTVTFTPNANNTPVVWLVQSNVVINGAVDLLGKPPVGAAGGFGGPGGYRGGTGGPSPTNGQGPGGGLSSNGVGGNASYGGEGQMTQGVPPGPIYGNEFLIPLIGGSGGGGSSFVGPTGGGGGGGAVLIAASGFVEVNGILSSTGVLGWAMTSSPPASGGAGSGGAIRIVASRIIGAGNIRTIPEFHGVGGAGRVRFDTYENNFGGTISGMFTQGFQPILIPVAGQLPQLAIASVAGISVAALPTGALSSPDVIVPGQQANPVSIMVKCASIPLNTPITVNVSPMNGVPVSAIGSNTVGTQTSSTATMSLNLPRGGGLIYARATVNLIISSAAPATKSASYAQTGLTTSGERFSKMVITAALGSQQTVAYVTDSGKRFSVSDP